MDVCTCCTYPLGFAFDADHVGMTSLGFVSHSHHVGMMWHDIIGVCVE